MARLGQSQHVSILGQCFVEQCCMGLGHCSRSQIGFFTIGCQAACWKKVGCSTHQAARKQSGIMRNASS
jgi:hypothetical protein